MSSQQRSREELLEILKQIERTRNLARKEKLIERFNDFLDVKEESTS